MEPSARRGKHIAAFTQNHYLSSLFRRVRSVRALASEEFFARSVPRPRRESTVAGCIWPRVACRPARSDGSLRHKESKDILVDTAQLQSKKQWHEQMNQMKLKGYFDPCTAVHFVPMPSHAFKRCSKFLRDKIYWDASKYPSNAPPKPGLRTALKSFSGHL